MFGSSIPLLRESNGAQIFLERVRSAIDTALQPIADIRSGHAHGFEALARETAALGFSTIPEFFTFAEEIGVRSEVDRLLYSKAAEKLRSHEPGREALLFLNLDRKHATMAQETLSTLLSGLGKTGLLPSDVCIEITEVGNELTSSALLGVVTMLRQSGFRIAIDDFGTGLSGLQALYELQPEYVKVDRFFISGLERDARKRVFLSRVVELVHSLGSQVVAEGIESVEELHACRDAGCDLVQGYFIARPSCDVAEIKTNYVSVSHNGDRRSPQPRAQSIAAEGIVVPLEPIHEGTRVETVVEYFLGHPECSFLPVVNARSMPLGIVRERDLRSLVQSPFGRDLMKNASFPLTIRNYLVRLPIVDAKIAATHLIEQCAQSVDEGIIVMKDMRYAGFVPSSALLQLAGTIRLRQAQNQNPLTHLPANDSIIDFISSACTDRRVSHAFCHLDFNNFKPFNDVYGFHVGDRAILMFADLMRAEFGHDMGFIGHIGGDDFFVGMSGSVHELPARLLEMRARFASNAESLYVPEHRLKGYLECAGRDGVVTRFPLLTCSIALLVLAADAPPIGADGVAQELTRLKAAAKKSASGFSSATFAAIGDAA